MCYNAQYVWYYFLHKDECITRFSYQHECTFKHVWLTFHDKSVVMPTQQRNAKDKDRKKQESAKGCSFISSYFSSKSYLLFSPY